MTIRNQNSTYFFSPHPDDETLACGGTIIQRLSQGYNVKIIVMTDGSKSHSANFKMFSNPSPKELADIRKQETKNAVSILGVNPENIFFLEAEDGNLINVQESMISNVKALLANEIENISEIFLPHENDYHTDHIATNKIVLKAIKGLIISPTLYFYQVYPSNEQSNNFDLGTKIQIDILDFLPLKVNAINQYKSQIQLLSIKQDRPVISPTLLNKFVTTHTETFWHY
ncbi:MAG: PIG-L family deacetylase [Bacteroidota bacterium]